MPRFGRPGKGNDKGKVENLVKVARRSFFVPRPRFPSWEALNVWLEEQCRKRRERRQRGHRETIGERFERDRRALLALPAAAYEACETRPGRVTSLSLVRYHTNDYSVPGPSTGHRQVLIKGYVDKVVICAGSEEIARHRRSYGREELIFHPLHYLALLETQDRSTRASSTARRLAVARGVCSPPAAAPDKNGEGRFPRVYPGLAAPRRLSSGRSPVPPSGMR